MDNQDTFSFVYHSHGLPDTDAFAAALAQLVRPGTVIGLDGDLGAGKTAFSQCFARHLGVKENVSSPTFTIIKEYAGRLPLYHMDVYRLSVDEADELGLDEYLYGGGVCLIEWSRIIGELLPADRLQLQIESSGLEERTITIAGTGAEYADLCRSLKQKWG